MSDALASASPIASDLYVKLKAALAPFGTYREEVKKTSIHLARNSAFLGVHPRNAHIPGHVGQDHFILNFALSLDRNASDCRT